MATKKKETAKKAAPVKETANKMTAEEKAAKRKARLEAMKNRPEGQRTNSKQIDVIEAGKGKVVTYGYAIRKTGTLVTAIALNAEGEVVGVSTTLVADTKVKSKKGHGYIQPGVAGEGKKSKAGKAEDEDIEDVEDEDEEDED